MSGPAVAAATSYEESVGSCGPPSPPTPPAPAGPRGTPVRRQLDFSGGGNLEDDDDDELLCRVADNIERGYSEAKRRASPCVCGRGVCAVERDDQTGRWKYVCPSRPRCNHVAFCEEINLSPKSQPSSRSHPKPTNIYVFHDPSNHAADQRTPVKVHPQITVAITPVNGCPQVVGAKTLFSGSPQGAGVVTLVNVRHGEGAVTPANDRTIGVGITTPAKYIPQGAGPRTPVKVTLQGDGSDDVRPICQCTAGKCKRSRVGEEDWYICPIPKGKGACSYRVLVSDFVKDMVPSAQATPCGEAHPESPSLPHRRIAAVNTPSKSPMRPYGTASPISPNNACFRCKQIGHWKKDCPKQPSIDNTCFKCHEVGHWSHNCPQL